MKLQLSTTITFIGFSILSHTVFAETTNEGEPTERLGTVQVTVPKEPTDQDRTTREEQFYKPYSRETVGEEKIQQDGASDITDAISDIPGVTINSQGAFNKTITIRGLDGPRVTTRVDGIKIGNQGMSHSGAGEINMTDLDAVTSIDVIKGSPSVVYDPGASGGIVEVQTVRAPTEKGIGFKQKLGYDEGYNQQQSTTMVKGGTGRFGALFMYSIDNAKDYKIGGQDEDTELILNKYDLEQQFQSNPQTIKNLGYDSEAITARGSALLGDDGRLDIDWDRWMGKNMTMIHGDTVDSSAGIIQYKRMDRDRTSASLTKEKLGILEDLEFKAAKQSLYQLGSSATKLDSTSFTGSFNIPIQRLDLTFGAEAILDEAETLVYSEQDYYAAYASFEYNLSKWIFSGGLRANQWTTRQKLLNGTNKAVAEQLLGISGITPEKTVSNPTWALGAVYQLTPSQNVSLNINTTYRNPDLYERYAFGSGFIGGGLDMKPESGQHAELAWKYLDNHLSSSLAVFYSEYENFINTKTIRQITDYQGLQECIQIGKCDPENGEYNGRENDFFSQYVKYYNSDHVTNWGAEFNARYDKNQYTATMGVGFNEIRSEDIYVYAHAQPIRIDASYKYRFQVPWNPWVKVKGEYVFDFPEVRQTGGFTPYFTGDLLAGFQAYGFTMNAGIRNITNNVYRPPYNGINALARSYFASLTYQWDSK